MKLLVERRADLKQMLVQEKNRYQAPLNALLRPGIKQVIACLEKQVIALESQINKIIAEDSSLTRKKNVLRTVSGIGDLTANFLLALVPELGKLNHKQIASLCEKKGQPRHDEDTVPPGSQGEARGLPGRFSQRTP